MLANFSIAVFLITPLRVARIINLESDTLAIGRMASTFSPVTMLIKLTTACPFDCREDSGISQTLVLKQRPLLVKKRRLS